MIVSRAPSSYRIFGGGLGQTPFVPYVCPDGSTALTASDCPLGAANPAAASPSMLAAPLSPQEIAALSQYNASQLAQPAPASFTAFLNANPTLVYWSLGLLVLVAFLSEGRR